MSDVVVWKHELRGDVTDLELHRLAEVLHVAEQGGRIQLWEMHSPDQPAKDMRRFRVAGTVSDFGKRLGNANDRLHGGREGRWHRRSWRAVDRLAGRLYTYGER